jgi:outer membrane receptor for ferrienterochelin and colicin
VELTGFSPVEHKGVNVRLGSRLELTGLVLKVGGLEEVVEVVGAAPVIDTSSTTAGGVLDSDVLKKLPVGRQFTETLYLVPGVSSGGGTGNANPSIAGGSGLENNYVVDGVNITNTGYGAVGSYSIVFGSLGNGVTTDFIKETQVKTAGFEAEYGQSTGGVVNVVTQSGTNEFHGSVFGYFRPDSLEDDFGQILNLHDPTANVESVNTRGTETIDFGATLGGPIMKDKLFFFGAFNPQFQTRTFIAPAGFPLESLGEIDRKREIYSYAGKLTWQASSNHRFDISLFGDPASGENGPQRAASLLRTDTAGFSELSYGGHNQVLKYDGIISRSWLIEGSIARAKNTIEETPSVDEWSVTDRSVVPTVVTGGIGFYEVGNDGENLQFQLKSTNIFDAGGNHQIRYGVLYEDIKYDNIIQRTGPTFTLPNGVQTLTGATTQVLPDPTYGRIFRVVRANTGNVRTTEQQYTSFFLQDTWAIGKNFTIRPGVRYEQQKLVGNLSEFKWDGNWAPRLGAIWDPKGNGKSKVYANWGRFYAKIPNDLAARALSADAGVTRADYFDANLTQPIPEGTLTGGASGNPPTTTHFIQAGLAPADIDPDSKSTYQDEIVAGLEYQVLNNVNFGVRYIHRSMPRVLEDIGSAAQILYFRPELAEPASLDSVEYFITNPAENFPATINNVGAFEDVEHKYDAVEITANKTFSDNWAMVASYRWSKLEGNFEGFFRNDNGQSDPAITSLFDFPTNDPTYTDPNLGGAEGFRGDIRFLGNLGNGPLPNDRTHQVKVYVNRTWGALNMGVGANVGSGAPLTAFAANPTYDSSGEIPEGPRGSGIQAEDGFRETSDTEATFDFHVDYTMKFGERRFTIMADAFNMFNNDNPVDYNNTTEIHFGAPDEDYGRILAFQTPRRIRLGARFEW